MLRAGGAAAALCGSLYFGCVSTTSAGETSVVFKRTTPSAVANTNKSGDAAPLEWRVRKPKSDSATGQAASKAASSEASRVALAQYEAETAPPTATGPILRAANDSVLLPPPKKASPNPAAKPTASPTAVPRRLSAADGRSMRTVNQAPGEDATVPRDRYRDDLPNETLTQPDSAEGIFGDQPSPTTPAPATPAPTTPAPSDSGAETPPAMPPETEANPPAKLPMPDESPLPTTPEPAPNATLADERDREIRSFLFGRKDVDVGEALGELGDCDKTNAEVQGKRVVDISVDISPKASDVESAWSYDRPWKDITGKTLFIGRPLSVDATSREATFRTVDGSTRRVKLRDLSRAEQGYFLAIYPLPIECPLIDETFEPRSWAASTYVWKASAACHKPLYFEDVHLERYGHSVGPILQPFASSAHFFGTLPILPYKMGVHTPNECMYTLGYYRPGNCAPYLLDPIPLSARGALFEAGAWVGGVVVIP